MTCKERCSEHCINNERCDHVSGLCPSGCQDGYIGKHCKKSCKEGFYGKNCSNSCSSNCKTCQHTDGLCTCFAGWKGDQCTTECIQSYGENCQFSCSIHCINETCERFNGSCIYGCKNGEDCSKDAANYMKPSPYMSGSLLETVGGIVGAVVSLIVGGAMTMFIIRIKQKSNKMAKRISFSLEAKQCAANGPTTEPSNSLTPVRLVNDVRESKYALPEKIKKGPPTNKKISVRNMKAQITNMSAADNNGFKSEYHDIPRGELHPCTEAKKQS